MDIINELIAGAIAAIIGFFSKRIWENFKTRKARKFWGSILKPKFYVVIGRFNKFINYEKSGFLGAGDVKGITELKMYFAKNNLNNFDWKYSDEIAGEEVKENLILIGFADYTSLGEKITEHIKDGLTFQFGDVANDEIQIIDITNQKVYYPEVNNRNQEIIKDYARITMTSNPFQPSKKLLMIVGSFGYGSWGGVRYMISDEFLNQVNLHKLEYFEALVEIDILKNTPQSIKLIDIRKLNK